MKKLLSAGINQKMVFIAVFPAAIVALFLSLIYSISQIKNAEQSLSDHGFSLSRQLASASEYGVYSRNPDILHPLARTIAKEIDVSSVSIYSDNSELLINVGSKTDNSKILDATLLIATMSVSEDKKSWFFQSPIFQTDFIEDDLFSDIVPESKNSEKEDIKILGWTIVELSLKRTKTLQKNTWINSTIIAITILFITAMTAIRLGQSISKPIIKLKNIVNQLADNNLNIQADTGASNELKSLESGINNMIVRLKASHDNLEYRIKQSTTELRTTLNILEDRNKQLESARHEAETANNAKSAFLANISHEVRTPLNGIYGFLQLLEKTGLDTTQKEFIENIEISTKSLLSLLNNILDFSKLDFHQININNQQFNLQKTLNESLNLFYPEAYKKELKLALIIDEKLPNNLFGDANRLAQIMKNLVSNSVKFTTHGEVIVKISEQVEYIKKENDFIILNIQVIDTGIGIKKEDQQKIFQPFSQIQENMNRQHDGSGLGLSITKSIVELMGGRISISSTINKGSCFSVILPFKIALETHEEADSIDSDDITINHTNSMKILLVDDNIINRQFLSIWLNNRNIHVDEASNGEEAIDYCNKNQYDFIFLDVHMPKIDGLETIKIIRENPQFNAKTPVIAITADATKNTKKQLQKAKFTDCLIKPVLEKDLLLTISKWNKKDETISDLGDQLSRENITEKDKTLIIDEILGLKIASGNKELWLNSLETLVNRLNEQKISIKKAIDSDDIPTIQNISHNIAGAASYCGATELLRVAKQLETVNMNTDKSIIQNQFERLSLTISSTTRWLKDYKG